MENPDQVVKSLKKLGFKITRVRSQLVELFINSSTPIAASDLIASFEELNLPVNKTTIYRELDFLLANGVIKEIELGERKKRYEIVDQSHHHHLICLKCRKIQDIELKTDLKKEEARIEKKAKFKIRNHNLEFFGYCSECK